MSERESAQFSDSTNQILRALDGETPTRNPAFSATTNAILDAIEEGGGGSGLPEVTSADNGKVLGVVNGAWDKTESKGLFVATITYSEGLAGYICDKTNEEILAAIAAGNTVVAKCGNDVYRLAKYLTTGNKTIYFEWSDPSSDYRVKKEFRVWTLGATTYYEHSIPAELPAVTSSDEGKVLTVSDTGTWVAFDNPAFATYTITGAPVDNVYPLSSSATLVEILAVVDNYNIQAKLTVPGSGTVTLPLISYDDTSGSEFVDFSGVTYFGGAWVIVQIAQDSNGATGTIIPLNVTGMTLDTDTDTLSITGVTEV